MHLRMILAIFRKDVREILLNTTTLVALISPMILAVVFVVLINISIGGTFSILVYNPDHFKVEQILTSTFENPTITYVQSPAAVSDAFLQPENVSYALGLIIPAGWGASPSTADRPQISLFVNGDIIGDAQARMMQAAVEGVARRVSAGQSDSLIRLVESHPASTTNPFVNIKNFLAMANLVASFFIGASFVPSLIVEEREKRTIQMLMSSRASWADVICGKVLVGLGYQILVAIAILLIQGGLTGQVSLVLAFTLLGTIFAVTVGLLASSFLKSGGALGTFVGLISLVFLFPVFFASSFTPVVTNPLIRLVEILPTYFLAEGISNAMMNHVLPDRILVDVLAVSGYTLAFLLVGIWRLHRQNKS